VMTRLCLASIAVLSTLAVVPYAVEAQKAPKKGALPKANQVYVKIILPLDPAKRDKDRLVVESWIAEELKKRGQTKFTAATGWVRLADKRELAEVWDGRVNDELWCSVDGRISRRADGAIKVLLSGSFIVTVSLTDEPGSRAIAAGEKPKTEHAPPYMPILIGPPPEEPAAPK